MDVRDIMSRNVITLSKHDTVETAARLMKEHDIGSIPICENKQVIGVITDRDIAIRTVAGGRDTAAPLIEVMSNSIVTGTPEMDVNDAARLMSDRQVRRLPICNEKGLVGIVALGDMAIESQAQDEAEEALTNISQPAQPHR
ncbi:CBS domain-containing protein [Oceanirhabdus sp. W0125-5]|uniref:CBS domain-containing protein n=1 Tax=Oceanirhabdus sp. W0125-5 TaxID=2999116 RepID=UPI0022F344F9|nr:CBS domain-containing protein [Oceanirhabdus sp. W0125-5]WBW96887.1 CBS domain-containing protein [Oceanirhabdus sp. W0125-5]